MQAISLAANTPTWQRSHLELHDVALCSQFQPPLIDDPPSTVTQTFLIVPVIEAAKKGRPRPGAEAAIRCYRRGRRLPVLSKKLRCTLVSIRGKIMAIYYPEDWRSALLTAPAGKITIARAQCPEKDGVKCIVVLFFLSLTYLAPRSTVREAVATRNWLRHLRRFTE